MISKNLLLSICLVIFSFTSSHSWAQMNATIIWDEIKHIASENGFRISALMSQSEEGIYITDFALIKKATDTNEVANVEIDLLDIQLLERDDGSVEIRPDYDQEIKIKVYEGREVLSFVLKPLSDNTNMIISGEVGAPHFQITSTLFGMQLKEYDLPPRYQGNESFEASIILNEMVSNQVFAGKMQDSPKSSFQADSINLFVNFDMPAEQMSGLISYKLEDVLVISRQDNLVSRASENLTNLLENGYNALGSYSIGASSIGFDFSSPDGNLKGELASENSNVSSSLTQDGLIFDAYFANGLLKLSSSIMPIPVDISLKNANYGFTVPILKQMESQNFGVRLGVSDLLIAQDLWRLLDPNNNLKNGPLNAKIALSGKAKLLENFTELRPDIYEENNSNSIPLEVEEMFLEKLDLSFLGTFLQGEGRATLDNEDLTTFDRFPKPIGSFEFALSGVNALVDKLISSGFIDSDTGMGVRMMLSMFTIPTGDDELRSKIEFNSLGHILANGQRLR